jgi:hypothetical protein
MGAIAWQVVQVKRKNSTNCTPPEAKLTVVGSMASRFGPREVAMGSGVAARCWVGAAVACTEASDVDTEDGKVSLGITVTGCAGAQAANKTASRHRPEKRRLFLISL